MTQEKPYILFFLDPKYPLHMDRSLATVAAHGAEAIITQDHKVALQTLEHISPLAFISNCIEPELWVTIRQKHPQCQNIFVSSLTMKDFAPIINRDHLFLLDHILAVRDHAEWFRHEIFVTLQKIRCNDIFGIEKYLLPETPIYEKQVFNSEQRDEINNEVLRFAEGCRLSASLSKMAWGISEELLMNALYDAPFDEQGRPRYNHLPRTTRVTLPPEEAPTLRMASDGQCFAISVSDPFGGLQHERIFSYVKKILFRADSEQIIDTKQGGAGLGFFKIFYSCHSLICNVAHSKKTEVIALIDMKAPLYDVEKMPRSLSYFVEKS